SPGIHKWLSADELPDVAVERTKLLLDIEKSSCILQRGCNLEPIANNARVAQQTLNPAAVVTRDALGIESVEGGAVVLAFLQNRVPAQAGLSTLEDKEFKENAVVVLRLPPFLIVITDGERVAGPVAADEIRRVGFHRAL